MRLSALALRLYCFVEKLFPRGGPGCVGVAEGNKRRANDPLAACGPNDELLNGRFSPKQG